MRLMSSVIAWAFERGCRVVELDCYDGGLKGLIIMYGGMVVCLMLFKDVIVVINDRVYVVSEYLVIVILENYASRETRAVMAKIMRYMFGDKFWMLLLKGEGEGEEELYVLDCWLLLVELKGKVIIWDKVKYK